MSSKTKHYCNTLVYLFVIECILMFPYLVLFSIFFLINLSLYIYIYIYIHTLMWLEFVFYEWDHWLKSDLFSYTCTVESILTGCITAWFGNSTAGNRRALQRVVRTARHIVGGKLPSLQDIYTRRCTRKARRIIKDSSHPSHRLLSLLPSGRRFRSIRSRTSRLRTAFSLRLSG